MAETTHNQEVSPSSSDSQAIIAMDKTHDETETGLTAPFNSTTTDKTITFDTAVDSQALFTIDKSHDGTDTSLTVDFNTEFVSQIVFDINLEYGLASDISSFDPGGIPIIFHERTSPEPIVFYERTSPEPVVFYSRGETERRADIIDSGLAAPFHSSFEQSFPEITSSDSQSIFTIDESHDEAETGLTSSFSTAVA